MKEAFSMPLQGFDAIRILSQIISLQALHYLVLSVLIPPLLALFSSQTQLTFEGGPTQVGMVLDWRELAARPTWDWQDSIASWGSTSGGIGGVPPAASAASDDLEWKSGIFTESGQRLSIAGSPSDTQVGAGGGGGDGGGDNEIKVEKGGEGLRKWEWTHTRDPARSWCIVAAWIVSAFFDMITLVFLVRRPTHILDHALTLHLLHVVITSYYSSSLPTSLFWWTLMALHAGITIVWAEQLAINREMNRSIGSSLVGTGSASASNSKHHHHRRRGSNLVDDHERQVLFDPSDPDLDDHEAAADVEQHELKRFS
ncbi:uncharacterized protein PFL1_05392 [Pseudozyma flocculosa PF-1]|uniref:Integral membrane protein n=2 Tax=Pseudozyma flocculosa TaxID=84751 RepID=A0A5C3FAA7_9BASI|nr:uncharacterized protein PFL1_05392 [Pseudozyma flocculosa PF-1]EPQ27110.1 hypothetical protein PFL1_05392 [Pseudozyma flocculosa PF-1]SPO41322.1 uncharacterized protein PSFLO_06804 [Pseudozyma flocculosa]